MTLVSGASFLTPTPFILCMHSCQLCLPKLINNCFDGYRGKYPSGKQASFQVNQARRAALECPSGVVFADPLMIHFRSLSPIPFPNEIVPFGHSRWSSALDSWRDKGAFVRPFFSPTNRRKRPSHHHRSVFQDASPYRLLSICTKLKRLLRLASFWSSLRLPKQEE